MVKKDSGSLTPENGRVVKRVFIGVQIIVKYLCNSATHLDAWGT